MSEKKSKSFRIMAIAGIAVTAATAAALGGVGYSRWGGSQAEKSAQSADTGVTKVVATVGDLPIVELDLAQPLMQGVDRAVALDRVIKAQIAADAAVNSYPDQASEVSRAASRMALSQLYVTRRGSELVKQIKPDELKAAYDKFVPASDHMEYRFDLYTTQDPREAEGLAQQIAAGQVAVVAEKFKPANEGRFVKTGELPYGLPQVLARMKAGDFSRPLVLRTGVVMLKLHEVRQGRRPEMKDVEAQLKDLLVAQKLDVEMEKMREQTRIVMK